MHSHGSMDMGGMGGSASMFKPTNTYIARVYWYIVLACTLAYTVSRLLSKTYALPTRLNPSRAVAQFHATSTAILRELAYPQPIYFTGSFSKHFTPPPLGQCLLLALYWVMLLCMLWSNTIISPGSSLYAFRWEIVGFRAAWVSVTQLPLVYMLSCKIGPFTMLTGISAERINWLHRWAARTMFFTVAVHWSFFYHEWDVGKIIKFELEMMPMVKYGFGAWAVLGWFLLSGFGLFRQHAFEVFILQHIAAAATLLWLVWVHVPSYAAYNVWLAVAFLAVDWIGRLILGFRRNAHFRKRVRAARFGSCLFGHETEVTALADGHVLLRMKAVDFTWKAGQHVYVSIPRLGLLQAHPFTILNPPGTFPSETQPLELFIKAHRGFTRSLYQRALRHQQQDTVCRLHAFVNGPWGEPPSLTSFDTVVLLATGSGISFTMPLLRSLCRDNRGSVRRVYFHWVVRRPENVEIFRSDLARSLEEALCHGIEARAKIHYTRHSRTSGGLVGMAPGSSFALATSSNSSQEFPVHEKESSHQREYLLPSSRISTSPAVGRPCLDRLLRRPIEQALGETAVVGCGSMAFAAELRNYTSSVSDERAVHKGTGAHGIFLHIERYGV